MLTPEIYSVASGIEDVFQFKPSEKSLSFGRYQTTIENKEAYEKLIDLPRNLEIWPEYIRVNYELSDSVRGVRISAVLRIDVAHPHEYLEALEAAGSLITRTDETKVIQCGL